MRPRSVAEDDALVVGAVGGGVDRRVAVLELEAETGSIGGEHCARDVDDVAPAQPDGPVDEVGAEVEERVVADGVGAPARTPIVQAEVEVDRSLGRNGRGDAAGIGIEPAVEAHPRGGFESEEGSGLAGRRRGRLLEQRVQSGARHDGRIGGVRRGR